MDLVLGKVAFTPKGEYNPDIAYERYDMVFEGLKIIISLKDENTRPLTDKNAWETYIRFDHVIGDMIADGTITTLKIANGAITEDKLSPEVLAVIAAGGGGGGGVVLSDELGNSVLYGVTQHRITEVINEVRQQVSGVQDMVNEIANRKAAVSLNVTPSLLAVGEETAINILADTDLEASSIVVNRDGERVTEDAGMTASAEDVVQMDEAGDMTYEAIFMIGGIEKKVRQKVSAVLPIFYGAGSSPDNAVHQAEARLTPAGEYVIPVNASLSYLFFCIPATMTINQVLMNGFAVHFGNPRVSLIGGQTYKIYQSSHTYDIGTVRVVVS
ncbi:MAG: hypothetical protein IJS63_09275 [Bacteroidaceae bacterium]|nr:hypothetical protein [Bacteroidaceae bacterium]